MAMQSEAVVVPEKIQWYNHQQAPPYHQMDERDGFLMWLRGEFAAANAIIDSLCSHLRALGEPGEYDTVVGTIQQRRTNWTPILHMQQYFPVADVVYALQQVGWRRQHKILGLERKDFRRGGRGQRGGVEVQNMGGEVNGKDLSNGDVKTSFEGYEKLDEADKTKLEMVDEKEVTVLNDKSEANSSVVRQGNAQGVAHADVKTEKTVSDGPELVEKSNLEVAPKTFVATEICDGKSVNIAEGLKLYEDLFNDSEISKLKAMVSDLRAAGRRGQLPGQTYIVSRRPMKGHGREMIQLGVPIADGPPEDEATAGSSKDPKVEPMPEVIQDVIERLLTEQVVSVKPDTAMIDVFNEGDHSHPHIWPQWYGRPVCVMFLTECDMSFGKAMAVDHPGDYRGALRLSLSPGSLLVMQGRCTDFARHAIPSIRKQRILIKLVKSQPKKYSANDGHRFPAPSSNWAPPPSRSPNHIRPKHFGPTGVMPARPPNSIQSMFVPTPVAAAIAFPAPVTLPPASGGWPAPPPRLPLPGTGVFLPSQGSSNSLNQPVSTVETSDDQNSGGKSNGEVSNSVKSDDEGCNGSSIDKQIEIGKDEEVHENGDAVKAGGEKV